MQLTQAHDMWAYMITVHAMAVDRGQCRCSVEVTQRPLWARHPFLEKFECLDASYTRLLQILHNSLSLSLSLPPSLSLALSPSLSLRYAMMWWQSDNFSRLAIGTSDLFVGGGDALLVFFALEEKEYIGSRWEMYSDSACPVGCSISLHVSIPHPSVVIHLSLSYMHVYVSLTNLLRLPMCTMHIKYTAEWIVVRWLYVCDRVQSVSSCLGAWRRCSPATKRPPRRSRSYAMGMHFCVVYMIGTRTDTRALSY